MSALQSVAPLKAPFPYFGGKSRAAPLVWPRFGDVRNYVEPFFGSGAMLLGRPQPFRGPETVNDLDGMIANFWRALQADPDQVAHHADWPVNENDLHARHVWLVGQKGSLQARLEGDPDFYDAKVAGWWVWGICCWIGGGFCNGKGPWQSVVMEDGSRKLVHLGNTGQGVNRQLVHLGDTGRGVNRQLVHLGNAGRGVNRQRVHLGHAGQGVNRQRVHLGHAGHGLREYLGELADRLRHVRVCCGDWTRICGPSVTVHPVNARPGNPCAVFLDPPYADTAKRCAQLYCNDSLTVAHAVREWAIEHGDDPRYRIALCGYEGEHQMPESWTCIQGKAGGSNSGYGSQKRFRGGHSINGHRERMWFSPHCLDPLGVA